MATILVYGDSNSHGTAPIHEIGNAQRFDRATRWPAVMAAALGPDHEVIAEGLPGRTTVHDDPVDGEGRNGMQTIAPVLLSHAPIDLLILMLGTNDLKPRFSVTAYEIARSVERLLLRSRAEAPARREILVAPAPVRETGSLTEMFVGAEARQQGLSGHIERVAQANGCGFVDAGEHVSVSDVDGVHWEADAHQRFGAAMARLVSGQLAHLT